MRPGNRTSVWDWTVKVYTTGLWLRNPESRSKKAAPTTPLTIVLCILTAAATAGCLQQSRAEINVLLQNIQSLITDQKAVSLRKVKTLQSLISQMERQRLPMKQQQSASTTP